MNTIIWVAILVAFVFMLTYDPRSRNLEKYIPPQVPRCSQEPTPGKQCESGRFQELQFGVNPPDGGCKGEVKTFMGAVI